MSSREIVIHELASWFGDLFDQVEIAATFNLILNAANMVKNGLGRQPVSIWITAIIR